ncbi:granzyme K-like [Heptranchias perlo]|uniref:granzyme K-like n=1 Tax=Heptranchias perlo TaxID=212740 RepID=UPI00355A5E15
MKLLQHTLFVSLIAFSLTPAYHGLEIIGGRDVKPHSKPYMASIQVFNNATKSYQHICGGALIRPNWVLTAAHCEFDLNVKPVHVVLGIDSLKKKSNKALNVKQKIPHICFDEDSKDNDIMLLQLDSEAKLDKFVNVLPLPKNTKDMKTGTVCTVAGWGKTKVKSNELSDNLKEVNVTIIDRKKCNSRKYYNNKPVITNNMLCAGDRKGGKDSCKGDSGGPLICNNVLSGIVSHGTLCGLAKKPGIYTRLTEKYVQWIQKITTSTFQQNV